MADSRIATLWRSCVQATVIRVTLAWEWWQSGVTYNPLTPRVYRNPYPAYAKLRRRDPVHWNSLSQSWIISRYCDVETILRDHARFSSDARHRRGQQRPQATAQYPSRPSMLFLDPPDHTRLRALVQQAFTPRTLEALAPRIRQIAEEVLDQITTPGTFDAMQALARPLPMLVMAEMLGIPVEERAQFQYWGHLRGRILEPTMTAAERRLANQAADELDRYFIELIAHRQREPREDLLSALVAAEMAGDKLTHEEMLIMLRLLLVAGNETTVSLIGNGLLALLRYPEQLQLLRSTPTLMPQAVEELLRYDAPVQVDGRTAMVDVEIGGRHLLKGQALVLVLGSANRDPEAYSEPDRLEIRRQGPPNLAFGRGIHHCLGAPLARLEARIMFEAILERFADMHLNTAHPPYHNNVVLRVLKALPIKVGAPG